MDHPAPDYAALSASIRALCHDETDTVALMATVVCEIHHGHPLSDWTGFYRVVAPDLLKIGPYQAGMAALSSPSRAGSAGLRRGRVRC